MFFQLKKLIKTPFLKIISSELFLNFLKRKQATDRVVVLMYHEVTASSADIDAWTFVKEDEFVRQMKFLAAHFNIVSLDEAFSRIYGKAGSGSGKPLAVVTFDDGYAGNKRVLLPIIEKMNIPVTIFVASKAVLDGTNYWYDSLIGALQSKTATIDLKSVSLGCYRVDGRGGQANWNEINRLLSDLKTLNPLERESVKDRIIRDLNQAGGCNPGHCIEALSVTELRELAESPLVTIGAHSHCHNILTQLSEDEIRESIKTSKKLLESWIGREVCYFSYPNGNYNTSIVNILKETGFECSLTTEARLWKDSDSAYAIPRVGIGRYDSIDQFKVTVFGGIGQVLRKGLLNQDAH